LDARERLLERAIGDGSDVEHHSAAAFGFSLMLPIRPVIAYRGSQILGHVDKVDFHPYSLPSFPRIAPHPPLC
jgi:hypothetical protein